MSSSKGVQVQPAYILHRRPFRETSLLLEVFSRDYGRVSLVARGGRTTPSSKARPRFSGLLQPFIPLLLSWSGRGSLFNLTHAEPNGMPANLTGSLLKGGWYMSELLIRTLGYWDIHTQLFKDYQAALYGLVDNFPLGLRRFEKSLLNTIGVLPQLDYEKETKRAVENEAWYVFSPLSGVTRVGVNGMNLPNCFQGAILLAVAKGDWQQEAFLPSIKRLFRLMLDETLAGQPIRSRDLL